MKSEIEEISEKYDRLAIKYRDITKSFEQVRNLQEVTSAQKESLEGEVSDLKAYISELETIIKTGGSLGTQTQQLYNLKADDMRGSKQLKQLYTDYNPGNISHYNTQ